MLMLEMLKWFPGVFENDHNGLTMCQKVIPKVKSRQQASFFLPC